MIGRLGPTPVVSRREILRAWNPVPRGSARARFQTLREKRVVSAGIRRAIPGRAGRFTGSIHVFSTLNRDSARLFRQGRLTEARDVAREASSLEAAVDFQQLVSDLAVFAASNREALRMVAEFPWQALRALELSSQTTQDILLGAAKAAQSFRLGHEALAADMSRMLGWVTAVQKDLAWIQSSSGMFSLPIAQLRDIGLGRVGTAVEVEWENLDPGEVIISTSGAVGSIEESPIAHAWTIFDPPSRMTVSSSRAALLRRQLENPIQMPSIPITVPNED